LSQHSLREILKTTQTEELAEAGTNSGTLDAINIVNAMGLSMDYESFVYLITEHLGGGEFAKWFQCFHHTQGTKEIFHLQHDFGRGWSTYLENYILAFLHTITEAEAKTRVYDYAVTLEVARPKTAHIKKGNDFDTQ
jgi:hypothetical protein